MNSCNVRKKTEFKLQKKLDFDSEQMKFEQLTRFVVQPLLWLIWTTTWSFNVTQCSQLTRNTPNQYDKIILFIWVSVVIQCSLAIWSNWIDKMDLPLPYLSAVERLEPFSSTSSIENKITTQMVNFSWNILESHSTRSNVQTKYAVLIDYHVVGRPVFQLNVEFP